MHRVSHWSWKQVNPRHPPEQSLFKMLPFTCLICLFFGVSLSNTTRKCRWLPLVCTLPPRLWIVYFGMKHDLEQDFFVIFLNQGADFFVGFVTLWLLIQKRNEIVSFLSSNLSLVPKLRRFDLLVPLFIFTPILFESLPLLKATHLLSYFETKFLGSHLTYNFITRFIISFTICMCTSIWFQLVPLGLVIYYLGFCVLDAERVDFLDCLSNNWRSTGYNSILRRVKVVSQKHQEFESIFGPFLFMCLCCYFTSTVYLISLVRMLLTNSQDGYLYYFFASCFIIQLMCIGMIFFISLFNEKVKHRAAVVSAQLEFELIQHSSATFLMINYLQSKICSSINEPLTAWKMVEVDRKVILTIVTSCVTLSVLFVQINNGALTTNDN